ncbi:MAG: GCN5-related N-acetyltransferase [Hyphomicrobiales bacterium]|nr:GCN5-related N-acetyltransferase [Hyphomicrobiales bacterium]
MIFSAPAPITLEHDLSHFACGHPTLDDWLRRRALSNQESGASRTYVSTEGARVVAYYALASGALASSDATGRFRRNMPDPVPVAILARLAVDETVHGKGLGRALFVDAARRVLGAASVIGIRGLIVHAISEEAAAFYSALGLAATPAEPRTLMITLDELRLAF